jgi:subtilase family serine protease
MSKSNLQLPVVILLAGAALVCALAAQAPETSSVQPRVLITEAVDENRLVTLTEHIGSAVTSASDRGRVSDDVEIEHMLLLLRRPAEQEAALKKFLEEQSDANSPNYHHWLTAEQYGERFGPAQQDIAAIKTWLESSGLTVNTIYPNGVLVDFSGTAGQVDSAFHTEIHQVEDGGRRVFVNVSNPQIPAALAPVILCVASMNHVQPHPTKNIQSAMQVAAFKAYKPAS